MKAAEIKAAVVDRLGMPGVVGLGLLLFGLSFWGGTLDPAHEELARLDAERTRLAAAAERSAGAAAPQAAPVALPAISQMPDLLKRLNVLAERHGLTVERANYQLKGKEGPRRLEVELPLRASYPALRAFLRDALALTPAAAIDDLNLQRTQASETSIDAQVRLSFAFAPAP